MQMREARGAGWADARRILEAFFRGRAGHAGQVQVGHVKRVGEGCSRDVFAAEVSLRPDPDRWSDAYAVLMPRMDAPAESEARTRWEAAVLPRMVAYRLPFRVPRVAGVVPSEHGHVLVRSFLGGMPLDQRSDSMTGIRPPEIVGRIAAAIHSIPVQALGDEVPGHATRRAHAEAELSVFDGLDDPVAIAARDWVRDHVPPDEPSRFIHGDLLGQNILITHEEPGVIDWEYSRLGDPAYDLAIVTRGGTKPLRTPDGFARILDAYSAAGGVSLRATDVSLYEICLVGCWYRDALQENQGGEGPEQALNRLRAVLRRAGSRESGTP